MPDPDPDPDPVPGPGLGFGFGLGPGSGSGSVVDDTCGPSIALLIIPAAPINVKKNTI